MSSRSLIHRAAAAVVTILTIFIAAMPALAADPPSITGLTARTSLSGEDRAKIDEYAKAYTAKLHEASDDASEARRVRAKLVDVVRHGGTSDVFRDAYSRAALPGLEKTIAEGAPDQAVTALVIVSQLGTEQALESLVTRCSPNEQRRHVRLAAARGVASLIAGSQDSVPIVKIVAAARSVAAAARREIDPPTLRHDLQAILAASEATEDAAAREQMYTYLVEAIGESVDRAMRGDEKYAAQQLEAIYPVLHRLRTRYIVMTSTQKSLGEILGPCVRKVLDVPVAHWKEFQAHAGSRQPSRIIVVCERFLGSIDRFVRGRDAPPPEEKLSEAWERGDQQAFTTALGKWTAVLDRPPYSR